MLCAGLVTKKAGTEFGIVNPVGDLRPFNLELIGSDCNEQVLMNWIGARVENRSGCQRRDEPTEFELPPG